MKKDIRLYNVLFPMWFLPLFPQLWLILLPANFLIDSLILTLSAWHQKLTDRLDLWKRSILRVWIIGFVSDLAGTALTVGLYFLLEPIPFSPNFILFPWTSLIAIPGVVLAGVLIYHLNKRFSFRKTNLDAAAISRLCRHLALFTAPYTMLIPLYG